MIRKNILETVCSAVAVAVTLFLFLMLAPRLESALFPVYKDVFITEVSRTNNTIVLAAAGKKVRSCPHREVQGIARIGDNSVTTTISAIIPPKASRPIGYQHFGNWLVEPRGDKIDVYTVSRCHIFWDTVTYFGSFEPK